MYRHCGVVFAMEILLHPLSAEPRLELKMGKYNEEGRGPWMPHGRRQVLAPAQPLG